MNIITDINNYIFFVINLEKDIGRKKHMESQFLDRGIDLGNVNFVKGEVCDRGVKDRYGYKRIGQCGCALSHYKALCLSLEMGVDRFLIVEDDCIFKDSFFDNFYNYISSIQKVEYDSVFFRRPYRISDGAEITENYIFKSKSQKRVWTECYFLSLDFRKMICENRKKFLDGTPVDIWYHSKSKIVNPTINMVGQDKNFNSNITKRTISYDPYLEEKYGSV